MKRLISIVVLFIAFFTCFAQQYSNELKGDVKMKEGMYEAALTYYMKARQEATSVEDATKLNEKIAECQRIVRRNAYNDEISSSSKITAGRYEESGMESLFPSSELKAPSEPVQASVYDLVVYEGRMLIIGHEDKKTEEALDFIPAGLDLPLYEESELYYSYRAKEDEDICFIVFKDKVNNAYGEYHIILRKDGDRYLKLDSVPEIKEKQKKANLQKKKVEAPKYLPIKFTEHWFLNLDANNQKLGDSRQLEEISAAKVCWLVLRFRYTCPEDYNEIISFDIKIIGPNKKVMPVSEGKKGYSTSERMQAVPGGGIFSIAFGDDAPGRLKKGNYIIEIWHKNAKYYTAEITLL